MSHCTGQQKIWIALCNDVDSSVLACAFFLTFSERVAVAVFPHKFDTDALFRILSIIPSLCRIFLQTSSVLTKKCLLSSRHTSSRQLPAIQSYQSDQSRLLPPPQSMLASPTPLSNLNMLTMLTIPLLFIKHYLRVLKMVRHVRFLLVASVGADAVSPHV